MRHSNRNRKLSKPTDQRMALLNGLVISLFEHGRVHATVTRLKAAKPIAEKIITLAKYGDIPARRKAFAMLRDRDLVKKIFTELSVRFEGRPGGYTRITRVRSSLGDNAPMAILELV